MKSIGFVGGPRGGRVAVAVLALALCGPAFADAFTGLSLKILNESVPPGGFVQMKVTVTEPAPIIIGMARISSGLAVQGLLLPGAPDSAGVGLVGANNALSVRTVSPAGTLGTSTAAPAIVVTMAVPATAVPSDTFPLNLDPTTSFWIDPSGNFYPQQVKEGTLHVGGTVNITDVLPGGGFLPAGSTVSAVGQGFQPGAVLEIDGLSVASSTWISANRIDCVTGVATQLDGRRVTVRNPDFTRASYFSYLRATSLGQSARPLVAAAEPIYPVKPLSTGFFSAPTPAPGVFLGVAVQNPGPATSTVAVELWSGGSVIASTSFAMAPRTEISREASEYFTGVVPPQGSFLRVTATSPVQMLGLNGNETDGSVAPLLPRLTAP